MTQAQTIERELLLRAARLWYEGCSSAQDIAIELSIDVEHAARLTGLLDEISQLLRETLLDKVRSALDLD